MGSRNIRAHIRAEQPGSHTKLRNDLPLIPTPRRQLLQLMRVDQVQRRVRVRLTLKLRPVIHVPQRGMPQLMRKNVPLRAGPQPGVNDDRFMIREPQPVSRAQRTHEHVNAETFRMLPRVVRAPPRETRARAAGSLDQRSQRIVPVPHPTGPLRVSIPFAPASSRACHRQ